MAKKGDHSFMFLKLLGFGGELEDDTTGSISPVFSVSFSSSSPCFSFVFRDLLIDCTHLLLSSFITKSPASCYITSRSRVPWGLTQLSLCLPPGSLR